MALREQIEDLMREVAATYESKLVPDLSDNTVLLESGLDSLGFAALVAQLEERLGFDPFVLVDEPVYPKTLGEFVKFYESAADRLKNE
jgi:acyl carrier protein